MRDNDELLLELSKGQRWATQRQATAGATAVSASDRDEGQRSRWGSSTAVQRMVWGPHLPPDPSSAWPRWSRGGLLRHPLVQRASPLCHSWCRHGTASAWWRGQLGRPLISTTPQLQGTDPVAAASTWWRGWLQHGGLLWLDGDSNTVTSSGSTR
jgi:hypothetical protein